MPSANRAGVAVDPLSTERPARGDSGSHRDDRPAEAPAGLGRGLPDSPRAGSGLYPRDGRTDGPAAPTVRTAVRVPVPLACRPGTAAAVPARPVVAVTMTRPTTAGAADVRGGRRTYRPGRPKQGRRLRASLGRAHARLPNQRARAGPSSCRRHVVLDRDCPRRGFRWWSTRTRSRPRCRVPRRPDGCGATGCIPRATRPGRTVTRRCRRSFARR